jgi:hypothetical protein
LKQVTAIIFILLFAFNWFGYRLMFDYMQHTTNTKLEAQLDDNIYDESDLIQLKVPVHVPYQNNWTSFERYNGEVEIEGTLYKYVKRKYCNDTLYLMCIPNTKKMHLETAKNEFFKITNDLPGSNHSKKAENSLSVFKNIQVVYYESFYTGASSALANTEKQSWLPDYSSSLLSGQHLSPEQPPDVLAA